MSGQGGMMMGNIPVERGSFDPEPISGGRGQLVGGPAGKPIFGGNPIDQPIPFPMMMNFPEQNPGPFEMMMPGGPQYNEPAPQPMMKDFSLPDPYPMPDPGMPGGKSGSGIDPAPIQTPSNSGANGPGLDHLKDYGPVVEQMKQYVQSMSGLIDQINSKF